MRRRLKEAGKSGRHRYRARVERFSHYERNFAILTKVTLNGRAVADHVWVQCDKQFSKIHQGNIIEFDADVEKYIRGYQGSNKKVAKLEPLEEDYKLTNISNIVKVVKKNRNVKGGKNERNANK